MKLVLNQPKMCQFYDVRKREKERGGKREGGGGEKSLCKFFEIFRDIYIHNTTTLF